MSKQTLEEYFQNLENIVKDVPSSNIFNYDKSNLSDDPGKKRYIYRRGVKYPEKIINYSKSCISIMVCGSADGVLLPPYVIYKSTHLYDTWKEKGPCGPPCCSQPCCSRGVRYNRTTSGWIDSVTFRDWFMTCFLLHAKRLNGRKVMIGDNLSSHIDGDILRLCQENDIAFVCLVPNSTHLLQPLDVAFFRLMKEAWRTILTKWKIENLRLTTVPKDVFPNLLNKALQLIRMDEIKPKKFQRSATPFPLESEKSDIKRNLISAFNATGIFPFNSDKVYKVHLPPDDSNAKAESESVLTQLLTEQRFGSLYHRVKRKKRLNVAPGQSVSTADVTEDLGPSKILAKKRKVNKSKKSTDEAVEKDKRDDNNEAVEKHQKKKRKTKKKKGMN